MSRNVKEAGQTDTRLLTKNEASLRRCSFRNSSTVFWTCMIQARSQQDQSFFSRMRRAVLGVYHRITPKYMLDYAWEMAWREDLRRKPTKKQVKNLVSRVFASAGISKDWINYGHGNMRKGEIMFQVGELDAPF